MVGVYVMANGVCVDKRKKEGRKIDSEVRHLFINRNPSHYGQYELKKIQLLIQCLAPN